MIYKTLHRKLKIEEHEHHSKLGMNSCAPEGLAVMHCIVIVIDLIVTSQVDTL